MHTTDPRADDPHRRRRPSRRLLGPALATLTAVASTLIVVAVGPSSAGAEEYLADEVITIPATGTGSTSGAPAGPYPASVVVAGAAGVVTDVNVTLHGFAHETPMDVGVLLVAPNGQAITLLSDVGSDIPVTDVDLTFDDEASDFIPADGPIVSGTYWPSDLDAGGDDSTDVFPAPAPPAPWATSFDVLDGSAPNGTWNLYVVDDTAGGVGVIAGGWTLDLTTTTASPGGPYVAGEGSPVTLSGATTPALPGATYAWDLDGDGQYDDATGASPTVSAATLQALGLGDGPDSTSVQVRATAGPVVVTSAATTLTIGNVAPTATLGNDGPVVQGSGATVTFTGPTDPGAADVSAGFRYSYDIDDDGTFDIGDGTYAGSVTSASASVPTSALATVGPHDVVGRIVDKDGGYSDHTTTVTVDAPPNGSAVADAGDDQIVNPGTVVTLDGTGSTDPDDDPFSYSWVQTAGPAVTLTGATTAQPTFTAPASGPLTFALTVDDDGAGPHTSTDTVVITVNRAPTADAGGDQAANEGDSVTLDGSGSTDPDAGDSLTYSWQQNAGPELLLAGSTTASPSFTAPVPGTFTFGLTVTDEHGLTDTDSVTVTVNDPPVADAGADQTVVELTDVTLDGSGSTDPDGDPLTYAWAQTAGPAVTLTGATTAAPTFTAPAAPGTLTFELTVDDGAGRTDTDAVTITLSSAFTSDEAWVGYAFETLMGRPADPGGRAYWAGRLGSGTTRAAVARQLAFSLEGTGVTIDDRYEAWLGRPSDPAGRDFWVGQVRSGRPLLDVELLILASPEVYQRAGGTDAAYVAELFDLLLARTPDAAGLAFWEARLASGVSRRSVASSVLASVESERRRVRGTYDRILDRQPDGAELDAGASLLRTTRDLRNVEVVVVALWVPASGS